MLKRLIVTFLLLLSIRAEAIEMRNAAVLHWQFNDTSALVIQKEFRFAKEIFFYHHSSVGVDINKVFTFDYRIINEMKNDKWKIEHRPYMGLHFKTGPIKNRFRVELQIKEGLANSRMRWMMKYDIDFQKFKIWIGDEINFLDRIQRNRIHVGLKVKNVDLFYFFQADDLNLPKNNWKYLHVIGLKVKLKV